jgi:hypothetical protein
MRHLIRTTFIATLIAGAGCVDQPPSSPSTPESQATGPLSAPKADSPQHDRQERLARRLAMALDRPAMRQMVLTELAASPHAEGKVSFQWLLGAGAGKLRSAMAAGNSAWLDEIARDAGESRTLELYFPVPEHRARWDGGPDIFVATGVGDQDVPAAFDTRGMRHLLDPSTPPAIPVLALVPAEQAFDGPFPMAPACDDCPDSDEEEGPPTGGGTDGGATGGSNLVNPGLYMTYASFVGTFESWLKGSPEFEVHVLGQDGGGQSLKSYQCIGEHAGGPYVYDQNDKTWSGAVVLFSQAQLDAFQAEHPGQSLRITIIEDDDGPCEIKTKGDNLSEVLKAVDALYKSWTGGTNTTTPFGKYFSSAISLQQVIKSAGSWINTNDEIVGTAVEDAIVGVTWSGANWIVKGEHSITTGGIHLEMR